MSQSLIHQVSDSDGDDVVFSNARSKMSQSLIHQVSDSEKIGCISLALIALKRLNPLFIRSQIQIAPCFLNANTDS